MAQNYVPPDDLPPGADPQNINFHLPRGDKRLKANTLQSEAYGFRPHIAVTMSWRGNQNG